MKVYYTNGVEGCAAMIVAAENRPQLKEVMAQLASESDGRFDDTGATWIELDTHSPGVVVINRPIQTVPDEDVPPYALCAECKTAVALRQCLKCLVNLCPRCYRARHICTKE